jgi:hypothetical protein
MRASYSVEGGEVMRWTSLPYLLVAIVCLIGLSGYLTRK